MTSSLLLSRPLQRYFSDGDDVLSGPFGSEATTHSGRYILARSWITKTLSLLF